MDQEVAHTPNGPVRSDETMTSAYLFDCGKRRIVDYYMEHGIDDRLIRIFGHWENIVAGAETREAAA